MTTAKDVDEYISAFPAEAQKMMQDLRAVIKQAAPLATEVISYAMPAFKINGILVYFAAFKKHVGFYPTPSGIANFKKELSVYKCGKGSVQFPLNQPLPLKLISDIVKCRLAADQQLLQKKKK